MKKPKSYEEVSRLVAAQLKPGVVTNAPLSQEALKSELEQGTLLVMSFDGGLLLTRQRETFGRLWFYLEKGAHLPQWKQPLPTVLEIPGRSRDQKLWDTAQEFQAQGFDLCFTRQRMTRKADFVSLTPKYPVHLGRQEDFSQVKAILETCFNPVTACLPQDKELMEDLLEERILLIENVGVLRLLPGKSGGEMRQLCVLPQFRGAGAARALMEEYLNRWGQMTSRLWVRTDFEGAIHLYKTLSYEPDGWISQVLLRS